MEKSLAHVPVGSQPGLDLVMASGALLLGGTHGARVGGMRIRTSQHQVAIIFYVWLALAPLNLPTLATQSRASAAASLAARFLVDLA